MGAVIHLENNMQGRRGYVRYCTGCVFKLSNPIIVSQGFKKSLDTKLGGSAYIALSQALAVYVSQMTEFTWD